MNAALPGEGQWHTFATVPELDRRLAGDVADQLTQAILTRGTASLAVSGGSTPAGLFAVLAQAHIDWPRVTITLVDDRWVADAHADSNAAMVGQCLRAGRAAVARFVPLVDATVTPDAGLAMAMARLGTVPWPLDVALLGMGNDAHTASLFPCADETPAALDPDNSAPLAIVRPRTAPHARITLTLPALAEARQVWLHIVGDNKRAVLENACAGGTLPVARVLAAAGNHGRIYWTAHA